MLGRAIGKLGANVEAAPILHPQISKIGLASLLSLHRKSGVVIERILVTTGGDRERC
jgi:hypothetical protein